MHAFEIGWGLFEVMEADDALRLAIARNALGDVLFQIDVINARSDGAAKQHLSFFFRLVPTPAIFATTASDDDRARPRGQQPLEIDRLADEIQPQLDQLCALLGQ